MKIEFISKEIYQGIVAAPMFSGQRHSKGADALDKISAGALTRALKAFRFDGKPGQSIDIKALLGFDGAAVMLVGVGDRDAADDLAWEEFGACALKKVQTSGVDTLTLHMGGLDAGAGARAAFGALLAAYRFDKYRTTLGANKTPSITMIRIICDDAAAAKKVFSPLHELAHGVCLARDLVSEPANVLHPEAFARRAQELETLGVDVHILDEKDMRKLGMNALLSVGQGSNYGSRLAVMSWQGGKKDADPVVLVGKGVCFDTGGISLKPGAGMWDMKGDMGGAAAVTGTMRALAGRKARANVIGIIGLVENMPDAAATRPGDIVTSADGQTIEVQNTDAEGRLVLVDALWYGLHTYKPCRIINLATLTGAIIIALGHENAGVFSNDDALAKALDQAGKASGETVWRLPLGSGYDKLIDSKYADMKNIGGRGAGSITAAQFLRRFVGETPWAHIDIAGTAWKDSSDDPREPTWATGYGVRLLDRFISQEHEGQA